MNRGWALVPMRTRHPARTGSAHSSTSDSRREMRMAMKVARISWAGDRMAMRMVI